MSLLLFVWLWSSVLCSSVSRDKRQARVNINTCIITPSNIEQKETPAKENDLISISCPTSDDIESCIFTHTEPLNVGNTNSQQTQDIKCSASPDDSTKTCDAETRIRFDVDDRKCGITINNPKPEDTGKWNVMVVSVSNQNVLQSQTKTVTLYTYNQSTIELFDNNGDSIDRDLETSFNYDTHRDEWIEGKSSYEKVEISCAARGATPAPTIYWVINGDDNKQIDENTNQIFDVQTRKINNYDQEGLIEDTISELDFDVNQELLDYLYSEHAIDINPQSGDFSFDLECYAEQGNNGEYSKMDEKVTVKVTKLYDSDALLPETVGMIVGIVLAVIVVILVVLLLLFAKATSRWCFEDDEYNYQDPRDPKRRPHTQAQ